MIRKMGFFIIITSILTAFTIINVFAEEDKTIDFLKQFPTIYTASADGYYTPKNYLSDKFGGNTLLPFSFDLCDFSYDDVPEVVIHYGATATSGGYSEIYQLMNGLYVKCGEVDSDYTFYEDESGRKIAFSSSDIHNSSVFNYEFASEVTILPFHRSLMFWSSLAFSKSSLIAASTFGYIWDLYASYIGPRDLSISIICAIILS